MQSSSRKASRETAIPRRNKAAVHANLRRLDALIFLTTVDLSQLSEERATARAALRAQQQETLQQTVTQATAGVLVGLNRGDVRPFYEALDRVGPRLLLDPAINRHAEAWWLAKSVPLRPEAVRRARENNPHLLSRARENNPQLQARLRAIGEVLARGLSGRPEKQTKEEKRAQTAARQETYRRKDKGAEKRWDRRINEACKAVPNYGKDWQKRRAHQKHAITDLLVQASKSQDVHDRNAVRPLKHKYRPILSS